MAVRPQSFAAPNATTSEVVVSIDPATGETLARFSAAVDRRKAPGLLFRRHRI
jgi:hypothetical protein